MGLSIWHIIIVLLVFVLLFGTKRLPELGTGLGQAINNFKKAFKDGNLEKDDKENKHENKLE